MTPRSIYEQALGRDEFARLHPQIQRRFGISSRDGVGMVGEGVMEEISHGPPLTLPFLYLGAWRRILFPEQGSGVPFRIENYAYRDPLGRETVTWVRSFATRVPRRFDAYMIYSATRGRIVDYLGTHQHLAVDLELRVEPNGGLRLRSGDQRFYERWLGFRFPLTFSGIADVCEWFDEQAGCYRIEVDVRNAVWGRLFGYRGAFQVKEVPVENGSVPDHLLPRRVEVRE